jgi:chromate transporter
MESPSRNKLTELAGVFLKLGAIGFGGPAAHIAMLEEEVVTRREWLDRSQFLDAVGATNLIPGPSSTELAIYIGYLRAGWWGLIIAGVCFIVPAMAIVWILAIGYTRLSDLPQAVAAFDRVKPVIVVLTLMATWKLGRSALKNSPTIAAGIAAVGFMYSELNTLIVLLGAGFAVMLMQNWRQIRGLIPAIWVPNFLSADSFAILPAIASVPSWVDVFLIFLKIGGTLYGGGYVLLAFLQPELVERTQWLSSQQLLDAIAIGQITPGPLFTTATFIGYLLAGHAGAIAATIGIFLPSFVFIALVTPWLPQLRRSIWLGSWLDGVNAGAWGAIAVVAYRLGVTTLVDWWAIAIAIGSWLLIWRWRVDVIWPILGSAMLGFIGQLVSQGIVNRG